jgi:hypothetical protein
MEKLKKLITQYGRWSALMDYVERIEALQGTDFSAAVENAKALLDSIGKEICSSKDVPIDETANLTTILKKAFSSIGYSGSSIVTQISTSLANIGNQISELRNEIGITSHGRVVEELRERNSNINELTKEFLIDSTVIVASFLIRTFENENPYIPIPTSLIKQYVDNPEFNDHWDDLYGEFVMDDYSYNASEILYSVDYQAYLTELNTFSEDNECGE